MIFFLSDSEALGIVVYLNNTLYYILFKHLLKTMSYVNKYILNEIILYKLKRQITGTMYIWHYN